MASMITVEEASDLLDLRFDIEFRTATGDRGRRPQLEDFLSDWAVRTLMLELGLSRARATELAERVGWYE
jgi:hypothetical protein